MTECDKCELEHTPELAKSLCTIADVLDLYGIPLDGNNKFALREERTPSAHAYDDHFWDFGAGEGGDVINLVMQIEGCTFGQALYRLIHKALKGGLEPGHVERQPRDLVDFTEQLNGLTYYKPLVDAWEERLGVPIPSNCRHQATVDLLIPHQDAEGVYGVKVRGADGSKSAWPGSQFSKRLYDPAGWVDYSPGAECVIAEGESDCWALAQYLPVHVKAYALPSGAGTWKDHWLEDLESFDKIWLAFDNDRAGEQAREKVTRKIGFLRTEQLRVPPLYNDAREAIAAGWRPDLSVRS